MSRPVKHVRTLYEKLKIIEEVEKNPTEKRIDIAKRLGLAPSTLNSIVAKKNEIRKQVDKCGKSCKKRKTRRESNFSELESVLFAWYQDVQASDIPIDGTILREKAKEIADQMKINNFTASNGWISRFRERHGLAYKRLPAESTTVNTEMTGTWQKRLPALLEGYEPRDIYNADETGLFYKCLPNESLILNGQSCHTGECARVRITVLLCVNSDGSDKQVPIVIGKSLNSNYLKNMKELPLRYYANSKAWMTADIFLEFLIALDVSMGVQGRKILLLVDDCVAHTQDMSFLRNVKVAYYPSNASSVLQPLNLGIVSCFKQLYRKYLLQKTVCLKDSDTNLSQKLDILQATRLTVIAWQQVSQYTIVNCFRKCFYGFALETKVNLESDIEEWYYSIRKNWTQAGTKKDVDFNSYVSVDDELATFNAHELLDHEGSSGTCTSSEDDDYDQPELVPSFAEVLSAFKTVKLFFGAHSTDKRDAQDLLNVEAALLRLKQF